MTDTASFYDQFSGNDAPVYEVSKKPFTPRKEETPHANRQNLSEPYKQAEFKAKCDNAPTDRAPTTHAITHWWRFFSRQQDNSPIAFQVNSEMNRNNVMDYKQSKQQYIDRYNQLLSESK